MQKKDKDTNEKQTTAPTQTREFKYWIPTFVAAVPLIISIRYLPQSTLSISTSSPNYIPEEEEAYHGSYFVYIPAIMFSAFFVNTFLANLFFGVAPNRNSHHNPLGHQVIQVLGEYIPAVTAGLYSIFRFTATTLAGDRAREVEKLVSEGLAILNIVNRGVYIADKTYDYAMDRSPNLNGEVPITQYIDIVIRDLIVYLVEFGLHAGYYAMEMGITRIAINDANRLYIITGLYAGADTIEEGLIYILNQFTYFAEKILEFAVILYLLEYLGIDPTRTIKAVTPRKEKIEKIEKAVEKVTDSLKEGGKHLVEDIKEEAGQLVEGIKEGAKHLVEDIKEEAKHLVEELARISNKFTPSSTYKENIDSAENGDNSLPYIVTQTSSNSMTGILRNGVMIEVSGEVDQNPPRGILARWGNHHNRELGKLGKKYDVNSYYVDNKKYIVVRIDKHLQIKILPPEKHKSSSTATPNAVNEEEQEAFYYSTERLSKPDVEKKEREEVNNASETLREIQNLLTSGAGPFSSITTQTNGSMNAITNDIMIHFPTHPNAHPPALNLNNRENHYQTRNMGHLNDDTEEVRVFSYHDSNGNFVVRIGDLAEFIISLIGMNNHPDHSS